MAKQRPASQETCHLVSTNPGWGVLEGGFMARSLRAIQLAPSVRACSVARGPMFYQTDKFLLSQCQLGEAFCAPAGFG